MTSLIPHKTIPSTNCPRIGWSDGYVEFRAYLNSSGASSRILRRQV